MYMFQMLTQKIIMSKCRHCGKHGFVERSRTDNHACAIMSQMQLVTDIYMQLREKPKITPPNQLKM